MPIVKNYKNNFNKKELLENHLFIYNRYKNELELKFGKKINSKFKDKNLKNKLMYKTLFKKIYNMEYLFSLLTFLIDELHYTYYCYKTHTRIQNYINKGDLKYYNYPKIPVNNLIFDEKNQPTEHYNIVFKNLKKKYSFLENIQKENLIQYADNKFLLLDFDLFENNIALENINNFLSFLLDKGYSIYTYKSTLYPYSKILYIENKRIIFEHNFYENGLDDSIKNEFNIKLKWNTLFNIKGRKKQIKCYLCQDNINLLLDKLKSINYIIHQ